MHGALHVVDASVVRRLATRRGDPIVTSLYLDVDGTHRPVAADYEHAFEQLADDARRRARAREDDEILRAVERDLDAMRARVTGDVDRSTTRGLALFSCSAQGWYEAIDLPVAVRDEAGIGPAPRIRQLVEAHDEPEAFLLALVDRTRLRLFRVIGHDRRELATTVTHQERSVDTSIELGSFEHHAEEAARTHLRRAAAEIDDAVRAWPVRPLVVGGPDDAVAELERRVHPTTRERIVGRAGVRVAAPLEEIVAAARVVADRAERDREAALVEDLRQRAAGAHGGVVGLEATLHVLSEQRVGVLLVADEFTAPGARCPACGHIGADVRQCPVCGTTNVEIDDVVEVAIEQAVAQGADVEFCRDSGLERFGSIAAIERYTT
jgi:peptide chain release factor subunit 1